MRIFNTKKSKDMYVTDFYVTGKGEFPLDMLRYDCCYPYSGEDAAKFRTPDTLEEYKALRTVRLVSCSYSGPTADRWSSFGWSASPVNNF